MTLRLCGIAKHYPGSGGTITALDDVSLTVAQGEFVVLIGPSGCGKSTLLQIVAGLERPSAGQAWLHGQPITGPGPQCTLVFQKPNLFPWLTALQNSAFGLRMTGYAPRERLRIAQQALEVMGLGQVGGLYPHQLSGGMQQRVALARALVLDPAVVLMDEPLAALDALLRARLQQEIRSLCAGKTVLFVTHSVREALILADRIVVLSPQPGHVQQEIIPSGSPPRTSSVALVRLEQEIEQELLRPSPQHGAGVRQAAVAPR